MEKVFKPVPDVEALRYKGTPDKPDIKIFVSHRIDLDSATIDNPLYIPVRCGAVYDEREGVTILGDDTGENISEKRMSYCELTVQYWAWKNIKADYYGLCHYRRFLSCSKNQHYLKNQFQLVEEEYMAPEAFKKYGLTEKDIRKELVENPQVNIFLPEVFDISDINNSPSYTHYKRYEDTLGQELSTKSINILFDVIKAQSPEYLDTCKKYYSGSLAYFCNCFIMDKTTYFNYCNWLFSILLDLEKQINFQALSLTQSRVLGFFSEDLFSIYCMQNKAKNKLKMKELQLVFFKNTQANTLLKPVFKKNLVAIVLSSDNTYAPYMGVLIQSIIDNSKPENNYDIIILHTDISEENLYLLRSLIAGRANFSIRFTDISTEFYKREFEVWAHYKKYNVYRLVAPDILRNYDKAVYLDSDIVINRDIAELYAIDLKNNLLAAVPDIRYHAWNNIDGNEIQLYTKKVLKLPETHIYFNSGVLVYNLREFRKTYSSDFMLNYCAQRKWRYIDQDVLNILCSQRTLYLHMMWNLMITADHFYTENNAPLYMSENYKEAHKNPYIVHYAGDFLPCKTPQVDLYWYFWKYARRTPFYEILLNRLIENNIHKYNLTINSTPVASIDQRSGARKFADKLLPLGTRRRKIAKFFLPKGSLRWRFCKQIYYIFKPQYRPANRQ